MLSMIHHICVPLPFSNPQPKGKIVLMSKSLISTFLLCVDPNRFPFGENFELNALI